MSESGGMPPPERHDGAHPPGPQPQKPPRRRRVLLCLAFTVLVLLLLAAAAAITLLVLLRPQDPVTELLSVKVTGVAPSVVGVSSVRLNLAFELVVRVWNPNRVAFRHGPATTTLDYRGAAVAFVEVPAGTMPSRGADILRMKATVEADRIVAAAGIGGLLQDVLRGEMDFEARTEMPGTVVFLGFIKRHAVARAVCQIIVGVPDAKLRRQECHFGAKL